MNLLALRLAQAESEPIPHADDDVLMQRFTRPARAHLGDPLSVTGLAQMLETSMTVLDRQCRHSHGCRTIEYIRRIRFDQAVQRLCQTRQSIEGIAGNPGYASRTHSTCTFVQITGRTPQRFRKEPRQGDQSAGSSLDGRIRPRP